MKIPQIIFLFFICFATYSQSENEDDKNIEKVEKYIIKGQLDSATIFLSKTAVNPYQTLLKKIIDKRRLSTLEYYQFTLKLADRERLNYLDVSDFINTNVKYDESLEKIDVHYFDIKWIQISRLRDEAYLDEASLEQNKLESYISEFNKKDKNFLWATTKLKTHPIVMFLIEKSFEKGKKLSLECLKIAKDLEDAELQIIFLNHYSDFLIFEGKFQEYIDVTEESLALEELLPEKSTYYYTTISHLLDAYIYKGGNNKKVIELLDILYKSPYKSNSYSLYLMIFTKKETPLQLKNEILKKFDAQNVLELVNKFKVLGQNLNSNDLFRLLNMGSKALERNGFIEKALEYKDEAIFLTRKIYSEDLSKSLAKYKTEQAIKDKEEEITLEKDKTKLYTVISVLSLVLLIIMLLILIKIRRQSKELSEKNLIINDALDEKELLIKEVHHRVKNNFQVIESLLEFQSEEIEDEKAIKLFNDGKNRVKSMALIHQKLYNNQGDSIDFNDYLISLLNEISFINQSEKEVIKVIKVKNIFFDVDTAIPLGLIINEIVTNTYKYAFKDKKNEINRISIEIEKQKKASYKLIIEDNGIGIPDDFNIETSKSVGLKLVKRLIKQLHGSFQLIRKLGTRFELTFKDSSIRNQIE